MQKSHDDCCYHQGGQAAAAPVPDAGDIEEVLDTRSGIESASQKSSIIPTCSYYFTS